jgi:hypothetical protein
MKPIHYRIEEIKNNGYPLDFGTVFESAFENYKKIALYAGLMLLVFSILLSVLFLVGLISYIGIENLEVFADKMKEFSSLKIMPLEIALPLNVGLILFSGLINPFMAGFLKMADCGEKGDEFHVSTMFTYYKRPYFYNIFIAIVITAIISTALAMLFEYAGFSWIGSLITILISFLTFLSVPLIVFGKMNAFEAIQASIVIVSKQALVLLGLIIVAGIGAVLGLFGFCIGIFFTMPFLYSMNYVVYKTIIGIDSENEIEAITNFEI